MKSWENTIRKTQLQRRGLSIFTSMSVAPYDDDNASTTPTSDDTSSEASDTSHVERLLSNGDFYMGLWYNDRPHGTGKYLWTDGCMYEGEWYRGKTMGKGKFSWPSGATYEGEFKSGFLDGYGTFTGSSGDTYRGYYSSNLKHGHGKRTYINGDHYEGGWRRGLQDGQGRYIWKCGHEYTGSWRNGTIHGKGVLVWANGNCYEGDWDDGVPCGKGQFRWADGSLYVGIWSKDPGLRRGVFFPSASAVHGSQLPRDPHDDLAVDLDACRICPGESVSILPSQKALHWSGGLDGATEVLQRQAALWASKKVDSSGGGGRPRRRSSTDVARIGKKDGNRHSNACCDSNNGSCNWDMNGGEGSDVSVVGGGGGGREQLTPEGLARLRFDDGDPRTGRNQAMKWVPKKIKKQGETIAKGHKNYELMLNLQLGIRHSVGKPAPSISLDLKASAFDPKEKVWTKFPPEGSKHTPPHQSCEFKWKDYCPVVFRTLRKLFKVDPADYMISICGNDALRELSSPGKSGSFFYLTHDDRYMIKTMKKSEVKVLLRMLPAYYNHVRAFENTLVTKFFGLHCVKLTGTAQKKVRFVIMGNLFCSEYIIQRRFDLKGSSHGRTTDKPEAEIDETTTLKDLDLNFIFRLQKAWFQEFHRQVDRDCDFLEQERIMDYSLLVGLHFRDTSISRDLLMTEGSSETSNASEGTPRISRADVDQLPCHPNSRWATVKLGVNMPARVEQTVRRSDFDAQLMGEPTGDLYDAVLFFGIIDILQDYDISKKLEHAYKSIQHDPTSISAVDPRQYSRRFRDFIYKVFTEDT